MNVTIKVEKDVDLRTLKVRAGVRYWEDATVDGVEDTEGNLIPCRNGDDWCPIIDLDTGIIQNWEKGKTANIHYKVCDDGSYYLNDKDGKIILCIEDDYVPKIMSPKEEGYGDYIIMEVEANGQIKNWKKDIEAFMTED